MNVLATPAVFYPKVLVHSLKSVVQRIGTGKKSESLSKKRKLSEPKNGTEGQLCHYVRIVFVEHKTTSKKKRDKPLAAKKRAGKQPLTSEEINANLADAGF